MKKLAMVLTVLGCLHAQGWHESFSTDATADASFFLASDNTWQWWGWGSVEVKDGALHMKAAEDIFGLNTCWVHIGEASDPDTPVTPQDAEIYVKFKISTEGQPSSNDQFHVAMVADPSFITNSNVYTVAIVPSEQAAGVFYFAENQTKVSTPKLFIDYEVWLWFKITVKDSVINGWIMPEWGEPHTGEPPAEPHFQWIQTTVNDETGFDPRLVLVGVTEDDSVTVIVDDIYYNTAPTLSAENSGTAVIERFRLSQNYPNPFNPVTTISYELGKFSRVSLNIYNLKGELTATLMNGWATPGPHEAQWDASDVPSGIYFYRLAAGGFSETRKMLLVK